MIRFTLAAAAVMLTAPAAAQTGDLAAVQAHLRSVTTMTADFVQTDRTGKRLAGQLTLKRPGKVRFQYQQGVPILIVADGRALVFIDYSVRQVQRYPIGNSPLGVLLDPAKDLSRIAHVLTTADPRAVLVEARDPKRPEYGTITLAFSREAQAPGGLQLQGWVSLDAQNNRTSIRLANQRFNGPVADSAFAWRDPRKSGPR